MSVTVVSCLYGEAGYERFVTRWAEHVAALDPGPEHVIVAGDRPAGLPAFVRHLIRPCPWLHPQAFYLQEAINAASTDWVWLVDIDDRALPDALDGLDEVDADVCAMGYLRSDGVEYVPAAVSAEDVLAATTSVIPSGSAVRVDAFLHCGGFRDVAFQDWALWRALAAHGAQFATSGRVNYRYRQHDTARTTVELTAERRAGHLAEMMAAEGVLVG